MDVPVEWLGGAAASVAAAVLATGRVLWAKIDRSNAECEEGRKVLQAEIREMRSTQFERVAGLASENAVLAARAHERETIYQQIHDIGERFTAHQREQCALDQHKRKQPSGLHE